MRKITKSRPQFDVTILENLTDDDTSCIEKLRTKHHLALHPFHLNNIRDSIKDILDKGLSKHSKELDGILCGYHNINIINYLARLFDDSCFIHLDIEADFYIFKPAVGRTLYGVVNKISKDHIGCLVHQTFNVSIPKPARDRNWLGGKVELFSEIILEIEHVDFDGLLPYIRGKLTSVLEQLEETEEVSSKKRAKKKKLSVSFSDGQPPKKRTKREKQNHLVDENDGIVEEIPKKRKKSKSFSALENIKKKHRNESISESDTTLAKKKRKKTKSHLSASEFYATFIENNSYQLVSEMSISENNSTHLADDTSELVPKKKLKKIKSEIHQSAAEENFVDTAHQAPIKKKKIKRDWSLDDEQSPKKRKVKRELDSFE